MIRKVITTVLMVLMVAACSQAQNLDGAPYNPETDPDIDMYIGTWKESMPEKTHGSLIERAVLTRGDAMNPPRRGAVLEYVNRFSHASLGAWESTVPTTLDGEQEILYIIDGKGEITANGRTHDLYKNITVLVPADLEFTITNTGAETLTMYLVNEPIPAGFRPNDDLMVVDENTLEVDSTTGHWCHIVKYLFTTESGLGTLERILTVAFDPMTIGHPHSHAAGVEEVWTALEGESIVFIGKEIRRQPEGTAYMIPPDGETPHSNINESNKRIKIFYFARYGDHEVRE